jgi:hypothetical protein
VFLADVGRRVQKFFGVGLRTPIFGYFEVMSANRAKPSLLLTVESTTPNPYSQSQEIYIPLTNTNVNIVEFHRSFFTLTSDLWLR